MEIERLGIEYRITVKAAAVEAVKEEIRELNLLFGELRTTMECSRMASQDCDISPGSVGPSFTSPTSAANSGEHVGV